MTTVSFAQDWDVDSRTRIDMSGDNERFEAAERVNLGATWGGDDWGIHLSTVVNYDMNNGVAATLDVNEAYASTDLMGYASLTVGRQALNYGSGMIISSNDWGTNAHTRDAFVFGLNLDMADITVGYSSRMSDYVDAAGSHDSLHAGETGYWMNASKSQDDWSVNLLYGSSTATGVNVDMEQEDADATTYMGLDLTYSMMGGDLGLNVSYNTNSGDKADPDNTDATLAEDMMSIGATYNVSDQLSLTVNQTTYGENGFDMDNNNMSGSWMTTGGMGYLNKNDQDRNLGIAYTMGDFNLGATMHQVANTGDDDAGSTANADYDRSVMNISLGYTMSDNANLSLNYATDKETSMDADDKYMWITLNIRP